MAVPDESAKHGVKLVVEDYPYAADGLELWGAITEWNAEYVDLYYKDDAAIQNDVELQSWWSEYRNLAHADKKDAPWPDMNSKASLVEILTTMQWVPSCQHAAMNFGQYAFAGFMPHHPTMMRRLIPDEGTEEWKELQRSPEKFYLSSISDVNSATTTMSVYEVLSSHAPDEVYIGDRAPNWAESDEACCVTFVQFSEKRNLCWSASAFVDSGTRLLEVCGLLIFLMCVSSLITQSNVCFKLQVIVAFERFSIKLADIDEIIRGRNADAKLKNRLGAAQLPYNLLRPSSKPGVTAMGIPNSITI